VEEIVRMFGVAKRKNIRVQHSITFGIPFAEGDTDGDDPILSGEEEHPTSSSTTPGHRMTIPLASSPAMSSANRLQATSQIVTVRKRRTATEIEKDRARREQEDEINYVEEPLMFKWRCQVPTCQHFGTGSCFRLAEDEECRLINAQLLTQWGEAIKKGNGIVFSFPQASDPVVTVTQKLTSFACEVADSFFCVLVNFQPPCYCSL